MTTVVTSPTDTKEKTSKQVNHLVPVKHAELLSPFPTLHFSLSGTVCDFRLSYGSALSKFSKIIAVNRNKAQLLKNAHIFWKPHMAIKGERIATSCNMGGVREKILRLWHRWDGWKNDLVADPWLHLPSPLGLSFLSRLQIFPPPAPFSTGDAASFLVQLSQGLKRYSCPLHWTAKLKEADHVKETTNRLDPLLWALLACLPCTRITRQDLEGKAAQGRSVNSVSPFAPSSKKAEEPTKQHLNPLKLLHHVDQLLPEDSLLVVDGGDFVGSAAYIVQPRGPLTWLDPGNGTLARQGALVVLFC